MTGLAAEMEEKTLDVVGVGSESRSRLYELSEFGNRPQIRAPSSLNKSSGREPGYQLDAAVRILLGAQSLTSAVLSCVIRILPN